MNNLLSLEFWLNARAGALMPIYQRYLIIFIGLLAIAAIIFGFTQARNKKNLYGRFWSGLYYFSLTNTIFGLFLLFFTSQMIVLLSSRFWFLLWSIEILVWAFFLIKRLREIPKRKQRLEEAKQYKKYIP